MLCQEILFVSSISFLNSSLNKKVKVNFNKDMYEEYDNGYDAYRNLFFINDLHWNKKRKYTSCKGNNE